MKDSPLVSVIVIACNEENYIGQCINSILNQTFKDFELIAIDDNSEDKTYEVLCQIKDRRLRIIRNKRRLRPVASRNKGIMLSKGKYIFFADGDCYPNPDWIEQGIRSFKGSKCNGVIGKIILTKKTKSITDKIVENIDCKEFMAGNMAFTRGILRKVKGFDPDFDDYYEDRDMCIRISKTGKIGINKKMVVYHQLKKWNVKGFMLNARKVKGLVLLYKRYHWTYYIKFRILKPREFLLIFLPFLLAYPVLMGRVKTLQDFMFLPLVYFRALYMRYLVWKTAIQERVWLI